MQKFKVSRVDNPSGETNKRSSPRGTLNPSFQNYPHQSPLGEAWSHRGGKQKESVEKHSDSPL